MAKKTTQTTETKRPITVDDHKELNRINTEKKRTAVNDALKLPTGDRFEADLTEILAGDSEERGETVVIALIDYDRFDHINKDFGVDVGDRILIDTGRYIISKIDQYLTENKTNTATVYRIGGDEFGVIFKGEMEREDIFLFLNELKNGFDVKTPDGEAQSITIGMATAFLDASRYAELVRKADGALYRAKISGRGRVAMAKEEKMIPKTSHYTQDQLQRLNKLSKREGIGEAILLREALDMLFKKYDI
ncbi:MAG: diguanylate cyclase [Lachnospiraceae bacterium]|nr:diguanylate cyclase [Lachnospiraceae bacterium]